MALSKSSPATEQQPAVVRGPEATALRVLLVDPSLFTAPYDAALTEGLLSAGVEPTWAVRPVRQGDRQELAPQHVDAFFYRRVDQMTSLPPSVRAVAKGLAHALGLSRLVARVMTCKPDVVHFQWAVVPALDSLAILALRRQCPVVLTVHDTVPCNGERRLPWHRLAFDLPIRLCDRVIVHTRAGRETLIRRGVPAEKVAVIPHGPLRLHVAASKETTSRPTDRCTFVLFGEIKGYKGADVLVEAVAMLPASVRARSHFIIAGRPQMDLGPLLSRIAELGLQRYVEVRAKRLSDQEMADLFAATDCFLFPYRHVDASGVYFLVKALSRWMIASRVGVFAEDLEEGVHGALVPPGEPRALADAIALAVEHRFTPASTSPDQEWTAIGNATRDIYVTTTKRPGAAGRSGTAASRKDAFGRDAGALPAISRRTLILGTTLAAAAACLPQMAAAQSAPAAPLGFTQTSGYRLVKNWDFRTIIRDDAALRNEFYTRYVYGGGTLDHLNDEWTRYRDNRNHEFTPTGLSLVARVVGTMAPGNIESGMLRSRWTGRHGVFEIRMKAPRGPGMWPAFWLNPEDQRWPPEIDVVEIVDNGRDTTRDSFHFLHGAGSDDGKAAQSKLDQRHAYTPGIDYAEAFHVFSVEWTANRVRHFVDGALVIDREYRWVHDDGADGGPAHVLLNLAVGGKWPGPPSRETPFPAHLDIHYVRVWQR